MLDGIADAHVDWADSRASKSGSARPLELSEDRSKLGYGIPGRNLIPHETVAGNVLFAQTPTRRRRSVDRQRAMALLDVVGLDKLIYASLKPGGEFFIEDHAAAPGSGIRDTDAMHRIDEDFVKQEVESVGFKLDGESDILRNPADDHTLLVFNPAIRGHTDQFLLRFRKPK